MPATAANAENFFRGYVIGPGDKRLRVIEREIDAGEDGRYLIQVAANADVIGAQIEQFEYALSATFLVLAVALIGSTALAVRFGLSPLRRLRDGLIAIRRGDAERIAGEYPQDLAPLAAELNLLLDANREVVRRARTQVGNLAHALKTPLSVIVNEAEAGSPTLAEKTREQAAGDDPAGDVLPRPSAGRCARDLAGRGDRIRAGDRRPDADVSEGLSRA